MTSTTGPTTLQAAEPARQGGPAASPQRLVIRLSRYSCAFSAADGEVRGAALYQPYTLRSGVSLAANLREAVKTAELPLRGYAAALVMTDADVLLVPTDIYRADEAAGWYRRSFDTGQQDTVLTTVLPDLSAVAVYAVNKDLKLVLDDNFSDVQFTPLVAPVWRYLHTRSYTGARQKLYAYFHDGRMEVFSFVSRRFKFCNAFAASTPADAVYYLLYVWRQLMYKPDYDELHLVGSIPSKDETMAELRRYLGRVYTVNPSGDFNRAPVTKIAGMPYDLMTYWAKGR